MLSKNKIKLYNSLKLRKYRKKHSLFLAEGEKIVSDLIQSGFIPDTLFINKTSKHFSTYKSVAQIELVSESEINKISNLSTPTDFIGVFKIPQQIFDLSSLKNGLILFLDDIQNPGNFGTIIRTANWFGINHILCSRETVDLYNPKVIQSTMGAISGVHIHYIEADEIFPVLKQHFKFYGTYIEGDNIYNSKLESNSIIIIGNEGKGISDEILKYIDQKISIPNFACGNYIPESLNASIATAIDCSEFRRNNK